MQRALDLHNFGKNKRKTRVKILRKILYKVDAPSRKYIFKSKIRSE